MSKSRITAHRMHPRPPRLRFIPSSLSNDELAPRNYIALSLLAQTLAILMPVFNQPDNLI